MLKLIKKNSKKAIALSFVGIDKIVVSDKFKHNDIGYKYFIGYLGDNIIRPLCILLPQMSEYIKYFDGDGKNISFKFDNEIWNKIKKTLNIKFHSQPIYDEKYIRTKLKTFNDVIDTVFSENEIPKVRNHYTCIAAICINSVMKIDKKTILKYI